ncbi:MAG: toll/interleukin-1 receptor domain-containing protein [bacterium]
MVRTKSRPTCFISYCHEDTNKDAIAFLVYELKELGGIDTTFYWDRELLTGSRLKAFMDQLYSSDAIILLLSPAYKRKVDAREGGVYEEYQRIMHRLDELESLRRKPNKPTSEILLLVADRTFDSGKLIEADCIVVRNPGFRAIYFLSYPESIEHIG